MPTSSKPRSSAGGWMPERPRIDLYCEDYGHEQFARALVGRLAREIGLHPIIRAISSRGGLGKAVTEFRAWQRAVSSGGGIGHEIPDLLVLLIDANCSGWAQVRRDLEESVEPGIFPRSAIGCPDPHVERWCLDPQCIQEVLGVSPPADPGKCERDLYKQLLRNTIKKAGQPILISEMEYAPDLVGAMNLFQAGKRQPSLKHFVDQIRGALQSLR
ncbi:MAG TPA: hypothetical protein VNW71_13350 [Thermoanaerobaculia bacterium]|nr:hypothetical protein [Thermoanaerobaculia bacterium]